MKTFFVRPQSLVAGMAVMVACVAWYGIGLSEEASIQDEPIVQVEEVVVSATKTVQPISQVTSAVEVITGEELERKKVKTVVDALRLAQGLAVFSNAGPGSSVSVRIRGGSAAHTLVLIDGAIVNSPTLGEFNFANLTTDNIEKIEILRGAQSMLWGSDAIGGVINIITKKGSGKPTASAFVEYGSFTTIREGAQVSGEKGPVDFAMSVSRWDTSNFSAVNYKRGAAERDGFHNWQASSRLGMTLPKDGRLEFNLRWWNSDVNTDSAFSDSKFDVFGSKSTTRSLILSGSYEQPLTSWWTQKLTLAQANERFLSGSGTLQKNLDTGVVSSVFPFPGDIETLNRRLEWQHNFQLGKPMLLTAGYQFREEQGDNPNAFGADPNRLSSTHAGFAQAQFNYLDRFLLTAGVRQDSYNTFGDATTYRVTVGYLSPETGTKLRASYATGFRAPTLNQLFFTSSFFSGNPNLKPEKSKSLDLGVDQWFLKDRVLLSVGYFWNRFDDLITTTFTTFEQVSQAKSQGWELGIRYEAVNGLEVRGQYTYTLTRDLTTARRLSRWPVHQASAGATYQPIGPLRVDVEYRYIGSRFNNTASSVVSLQKQGSSGVVNVSATYEVTKQVQVFGRVDNLFDQDYEEVLFFGTPIRSVYGGVKVTY